MSYNWEEILKEKSDIELFNIYKGRTHLSGEAVEFAKKELENRNVDFNNLGTFLHSVKTKQSIENIKSFENSVNSIGTVIQAGIVFFLVLSFSFFLNNLTGLLEIFDYEIFIFFAVVILLFTGVEFIIYNNQSKKLKKLQKMTND